MAKTGGPSNIMLQARRMQSQIKTLQETLPDRDFEGVAGGGLVRVVVDGRQNVKLVKIDTQAFNPEDPDEMADLVMAAVNMAITASRESTQAEMKKITGGINLPGLV